VRFPRRDHDGDVNVPGGPRLSPDGNRQPSDQGPLEVQGSEVRVEPHHGTFKAVQGLKIRERRGLGTSSQSVVAWPLQPFEEAPLDLGRSLTWMLSPQLLAHEILSGLVEL
jgi:hypothetical protein